MKYFVKYYRYINDTSMLTTALFEDIETMNGFVKFINSKHKLGSDDFVIASIGQLDD